VGTPNLSSFDIVDADIRDVMRSLADLGDINILMDPAVKGPVTLKLKHGLTIREAIELISQTNGYSCRWLNDSRTVIVGNEKSFANFETAQTRVFQLRYAQADQLADALKVLVAKDKIGIDLRTNQITVKASVLELQNVEEAIARLDRQMPQINIEARVEELTKSASKQLGLTYSFKEVERFSVDPLDFKVTTVATLNALEEQNQARMLARPNISTTDSQEGRIFIGSKYPIITSKANSNGGTDVTITYVEFGTSLTVTPRINENGVVTVTVKAFVSSATEWKTASDGSEVPVVATREASSVVRLKDGETFVLSGLNMQKSSLGTSQVPGLSKIPLLGHLFRNKNDKPFDDTEICIFVTPKIIGGEFHANEPKAGARKDTMSQPVKAETETAQATSAPAQTSAESVGTVAISAEPMLSKPAADTQTVVAATEDTANVPSQETEKTIDNAAVTAAPSENGNVQDSTVLKTGDPLASQEPAQVETDIPMVFPDTLNQSEPQNTAPEAIVQPADSKKPNFIPAVGSVPGMKVTVKVQRGEGLVSIARRYGLDPETIARENHLPLSAGLKVNQRLVISIPGNHLYQVKSKETLWRIAKRYDVSVETLKKLNNIRDIEKVGAGRMLILPVAVDQIVDKSV
jgi:LysM repeat protein